MNIKRCLLIAVAMLVIIWSQVALHAAQPDNTAEPGTEYLDPNGDFSNLAEPEALRLAYWVLYRGNHNYNGHRAVAMRQIRGAAKLLGVELQGDGKGHEEQSISDGRFHLAQRLLEQARSRLTAEQQKPVLEHVDQALWQISLGLKIRAVEDEPQP